MVDSPVYLVTTAVVVVLSVVAAVVALRRGLLRGLTMTDLAVCALVTCLLYVSTLPWAVAFAKVPGLDALIYSIPYTAVLLLGLGLVPKPGAAALMVVCHGLLGQLLGRGLNPLWWPYYVACGVAVELLLVIPGVQPTRLQWATVLGVARGLVSYLYTYLVMAPLAWHKYYPAWYVCLKTALGLVGCLVGAFLAWKLAPRIERAGRVTA